jgi:predicted GIY-YIG superfamily endonuclease
MNGPPALPLCSRPQHRLLVRFVWTGVVVVSWAVFGWGAGDGSSVCGQQPTDLRPPPVVQNAPSISEVIIDSFRATHGGWSSDEVVLQNELNDAFIGHCLKRLPQADPAELNWRLLNLRKAGLLDVKTTQSNRKSVARFTAVAEIVARTMIDNHGISIDRILTSPKLRKEFDAIALNVDGKTDLYSVRKAAFSLRKQRRLKPELVARIADWGREIYTFSLQAISNDSQIVPQRPGIYIFRDASGYLYIGQSVNLRMRLKEHLDASSNFSLGQYLNDSSHVDIQVELHAFASDSRAKETMIRRAYESELIASRKPKFNIQP